VTTAPKIELDFSAPPQTVREVFSAMLAQMPVPSDAEIVPAALGAMSGIRISSPGVAEDGALMYIHGGCYIAGSAESIRGLVASLGKASRLTAYAMNYRLAPEHPCPAAIEDTVAAYKGLIAKGFSPARIVIGGESSGAGLTLATLVALRDAGVALPAAAFLLSPWTDLALRGASLLGKAKVDPLLTERGLRAAAAHYLGGGVSRESPKASPLYADLRGLPPTLIHAGSTEILLDDATRTAGALATADVDVTLQVWPGVPHGFHVMGANLPPAVKAIDAVGAFLAARIATASMSSMQPQMKGH
jgi:acetyl esterase/lipase